MQDDLDSSLHCTHFNIAATRQFEKHASLANRQTGQLGNASGSKPTAPMYFNSCAGIEKLPLLVFLL